MPCENLAPASGRQDHTTSPSAPVRSSRATKASTASRTNVRDDRDTPLLPRRDGANITTDLGFGKSEIFFARGLDRGIKKQPVGQSVALAAVLRASPNFILRIFHRHCEELLRRSNPSRSVRGFGLLRSSDGALRRADGSQ